MTPTVDTVSVRAALLTVGAVADRELARAIRQTGQNMRRGRAAMERAYARNDVAAFDVAYERARRWLAVTNVLVIERHHRRHADDPYRLGGLRWIPR